MQTHLKRAVKARKFNTTPSGKEITEPGRAVNIIQALNMYQAGTLEQKAKHFFEQSGQVVPNFDMMDKIEKLQALAEARNNARDAIIRLRELDEQEYQETQKFILNKLKEDARQLQQQPGEQRSANGPGGSGDSKGQNG